MSVIENISTIRAKKHCTIRESGCGKAPAKAYLWII
jgi:hypothetical protein